MKNGKGKFEWSDGTSYEGEVLKNVFEGQGAYKWEDGRKYSGMWKAGEMHGEG